MAYCDIDDVKALNPKRTYSATTTPTETQVEGYIDDIAVEIDNILQAQGYTVPVTTPTNFVDYLKTLNARGAAAQAEMAMFPDTMDGMSARGAQLLALYKDGLKALRNGEIAASLSPGETSSDVGSYYHAMTDQEDFPEPTFRISDSNLQF